MNTTALAAIVTLWRLLMIVITTIHSIHVTTVNVLTQLLQETFFLPRLKETTSSLMRTNNFKWLPHAISPLHFCLNNGRPHVVSAVSAVFHPGLLVFSVRWSEPGSQHNQECVWVQRWGQTIRIHEILHGPMYVFVSFFTYLWGLTTMSPLQERFKCLMGQQARERDGIMYLFFPFFLSLPHPFFFLLPSILVLPPSLLSYLLLPIHSTHTLVGRPFSRSRFEWELVIGFRILVYRGVKF